MYQKDHASLCNTATEVKGDFEGKDADEPWLGGRKSWVSQKSHHWVNGEYVLGVETDDPYDPDICYDLEDICSEAEEEEDGEGFVDIDDTEDDESDKGDDFCGATI